MFTAIGLTAIALSVLTSDVDAKFIARVEKTEWLDSEGKPISRVQRDADGNVEVLRLHGMHVSADDFAAIGQIRTLQYLSLDKTNVADSDLKEFRKLPHLKGLNLTNTDITDAAIDEIVKFASLRSLCLGNVTVTPAAVARLKEHSQMKDRRLSLGYTQRK